MKSRVLGLACAAGLAAGCQSSAARALSRYQATNDKAGEVAQTSHETKAGLPGASKRREETTPQSHELTFEMGEKALQQFYNDKKDKPAHLQRARVNFEAAAKADPAYAAAQHRLAIIADLQERFSESESYYRTAMSLDPSNANIAADLGWSYILQERWPDAERALQRAIQLDPNSKTMARQNLAICRQHQQAATQVAATNRAQPGQMLANQPATVGPDQGAPAGNWNQPGTPEAQRQAPPIAPDRVGEYLRNQLAQIDQYGSAPAGQSLTIGPRQGAAPMQSIPQQQFAGQPIAQASGVQPQYGNPAMQGQPYQQPPVQDASYAARSAPRPTQAPFVHIEPGSQQRSAPANSQPQVPPQYAGAAANGQPQGGRSGEWPQQYGSDRIQRTQALESPVRPDQAVYQAPQLPALPAQPGQAGYPQQPYQQQAYQAPQSSAPSTGFAQQQPVQGGQPQASALDKARRDAALMGLGLGPGQLFPTLEQPADRTAPDRMSAGSNSQLSGAAFGAPPIRSPDLTPPPDLRQMPSFFEQQPMTPPTNSMGQTMPGGTSSMMTPGTVNDPNARFQQSYVNPAAGMTPHAPSTPNVWNQSGMQSGLQGYDDSRRAADLQLQQTLQNTWTNTPSGAVPSPAGGVPMPGMAPQSQMMNESWGRQPVAPPPYQQAAPPQTSRNFEPIDLPSVNPSPSRSPSAQADNFPPPGRGYQPLYRDGIVVPEQYGPGR